MQATNFFVYNIKGDGGGGGERERKKKKGKKKEEASAKNATAFKCGDS